MGRWRRWAAWAAAAAGVVVGPGAGVEWGRGGAAVAQLGLERLGGAAAARRCVPGPAAWATDREPGQRLARSTCATGVAGRAGCPMMPQAAG
eukprot:10607641-Alexandrium_andersonii.AAC.1